MYTWKLTYRGPSPASGTLVGDPLVALMCARDQGIFSEEALPPGETAPFGWTAGTLECCTAKGRILRAKVIARIGGQWTWIGGFDSPGTRYFDFAAREGLEIEVDADKPAGESQFASQLEEAGWSVVA